MTFNIQLDYRYDSAGWFTQNANRQAALVAATAIWENLILDEFDNIPIGTKIRLRNPETGVFQEFNSDVEIDDVLITVGSRSNLGVLGNGGPSATYIIGRGAYSC